VERACVGRTMRAPAKMPGDLPPQELCKDPVEMGGEPVAAPTAENRSRKRHVGRACISRSVWRGLIGCDPVRCASRREDANIAPVVAIPWRTKALFAGDGGINGFAHGLA
jgi:hypothetical protein